MVFGLQLEQLWSGEETGRFETVLEWLKSFWKPYTFRFGSETHTNEVVGVVVFFGGKMIEVCRVLVLHRQIEGPKVNLTGPLSESTAQRWEFITLMISNLLQASSTSSRSPSCLAWGPLLVWLLWTERKLKSV